MNIIAGCHLDLKDFSYDILKLLEYVKRKEYKTLQTFYSSTFEREALGIKKRISDLELNYYFHAPYTLNFCIEPGKNIAAFKTFKKEIELAEHLGLLGYVIHFGTRTVQGEQIYTYDEAVDNFCDSILSMAKYLFDKNYKIKVLIETTACDGYKIGKDFKDYTKIINKLSGHSKNYNKHVNFCIDTCHIFSCGIDIRKKQGILSYFTKFDELIGLNRISLIHLNDSKKELGSGTDRHASLTSGEGKIFNSAGISESLESLKDLCSTFEIPIILEVGIDHSDKDYKYLIQDDNANFAISNDFMRERVNRVIKEIVEIYDLIGDEIRSKTFKGLLDLISSGTTNLIYSDEENYFFKKKYKGIGPASIALVKEIIEYNSSTRLRDLKNSPEYVAIQEFKEIPYMTIDKAKMLVAKGITGIDQLKNHPEELTNSQKLGLDFAEELRCKIDRNKVRKLRDILERFKFKFDGLATTICILGSFRRQKKQLGDIDVLVNLETEFYDYSGNSDGKIQTMFIEQLEKFIKDSYDIEFVELGNFIKGKYVSSYVVSLDEVITKMDIRVSVNSTFYTHKLYFTGSKEFNEKIRGKAKSKGMMLNEFGLYKLLEGEDGVIKEKVVVKDEEDIFRVLDMKYVDPVDR